ncbi:redoxin domain-containing protein [Besnoitia besnoiti]|uniref:Redoxin domain-containing protein n=1 Tax=Besnoitia besnoiti TaxID=94643 RepID=A0A2A9MH33_BESBE|nr:redoxin domain-containing protein [Besnoitia besnoiti]PFH34712.1 redoxin domain-containing protein [Besnoitia besnoiti]
MRALTTISMARMLHSRLAMVAPLVTIALAALGASPMNSFSLPPGANAVGSGVTLASASSASSTCSSSAPSASVVFSSALRAASSFGAGSLAFAKTRPLSQGDPAPACVWRIRVAAADGGKTWGELDSKAAFTGKRVVVFSLPGAFTPTCSSRHLPDFERLYDSIRALGIDEVYCLSVNDAFVMDAWASSLSVRNVKMIPDGNACFTSKMGMLVDKSNLGFGPRSWRYAMVVQDGTIEKLMVEPSMTDNADDDPFVASSAQSVLDYLRETPRGTGV